MAVDSRASAGRYLGKYTCLEKFGKCVISLPDLEKVRQSGTAEKAGQHVGKSRLHKAYPVYPVFPII